MSQLKVPSDIHIYWGDTFFFFWHQWHTLKTHIWDPIPRKAPFCQPTASSGYLSPLEVPLPHKVSPPNLRRMSICWRVMESRGPSRPSIISSLQRRRFRPGCGNELIFPKRGKWRTYPLLSWTSTWRRSLLPSKNRLVTITAPIPSDCSGPS